MKKKYTATILMFIALSTILSACSIFQLEFADYRHQEPSQYYLYAPPNYTGESAWPAFIFVGGFGQSGRDCMSTWVQYAEEYEYILICPILASADGGWMQSDGEEKVVAVLRAVAEDYNLKSKSFMAGFSAGAQFMIGYTFAYPNFVSGTSIISTGNTYTISLAAAGVPFLITIGENDPNRIDLATRFNADLNRAGFNSSYYVIKDAAHEVSESAINLTLQLFKRQNP